MTAAEFRVGAARAALPMPLGQQMAGYALRAAPATGVHDDLFVRALVISDEQSTVCLLSLDLLSVDADLTCQLRAQLARLTGIEPAAVLVAATHTHAGPAGLTRFAAAPGAEQYLGIYDAAMVEAVISACGRAAGEASRSRIPARGIFEKGQTLAVAANRLMRGGVHDPAIPWLFFVDREDRTFAGLYSFACHPTVLGPDNLCYSGDLSGAICRMLEARFGHEAVVLGFTGAAGNISTRFTRRTATFAEVERLAAIVASAIDLETAVLLRNRRIDSAQAQIELPLKPAPDSALVRRQLANLEQKLALAAERAERAAIEATMLGLRLSLDMPQRNTASLTTEVQVISIGEAKILAFPGEMFVEYGLKAQEQLQARPTFIAGYANDYVGYVPTRDTLAGYEAAMAVLAPEAGETLLENALTLARSSAQAARTTTDRIGT